MTTKRFKSDLMASVHESAVALAKVGAIDKATLRSFDKLCIAKAPDFEPAQIKQIREKVKVSQPVFALYLNTSESTIQKWETGNKQPSGMALKLLAVVQKHGLQVLT
jgi:putative transcriptional regulator